MEAVLLIYLTLLGCNHVVSAGDVDGGRFVSVDGVKSELRNDSLKYEVGNSDRNGSVQYEVGTIEPEVVENVMVTVEQGDVVGVVKVSVKDGSKFHAFLGIPYAKPPVGELRFRAPEPPEPWNGALVANRSDVKCWQRNMITKEVEGSEDCLILHVYTTQLPVVTASTPSSLKPVMVWIHGGGFETGSASFDIYGPDFLLAEQVVVVSINYRLGVFGFLDLGDSSVSRNAGLKDQVAALRWVRDNIAQFNGDPKQVTIFGQSAGAACVHMHLLSPLSKGLFHRAISQSGSALSPWAHTTSGHSHAMLLAKTMGCDRPRDQDTVNCLREASGFDLVDNSHNHTLTKEDERHNIRLPFVPSTEQDYEYDEAAFLPGDPITILETGGYNQVPHMIGVNSQETVMFLPLYGTPDVLTDINKDFARMIPVDMHVKEGAQERDFAKRIKKFYFGEKLVSSRTMANLINLTTDLLFTNGIYKTVKIQTQVSGSPVFFYQFSYDGQLGFMKRLAGQGHRPGATHCDELGYLFNLGFWEMKPGKDSDDAKTRRRMVKMWTNFAKTGNPSSELIPELTVTWTPSSATEVNYLSIDRDLRMRNDMEHMGFWDGIYDEVKRGVTVTAVTDRDMSSNCPKTVSNFIILVLCLLSVVCKWN